MALAPTTSKNEHLVHITRVWKYGNEDRGKCSEVVKLLANCVELAVRLGTRGYVERDKLGASVTLLVPTVFVYP